MNLPPFAEDGLPEGWPQDHGIPTLGPEVLAWAETELVQPDGDEAGSPWRWRETQARYVCWWYALTEGGDWLYRRGQIVLPKGSGKSPLAAGLSCCELAGPVKFDGWSGGEPVGRPHPSPWVQLAAVSQDQTDNTMSLVLAMLREGPAARHIPGLDAGLSRVRTSNGMLQPVTASAPSREGQRTTAAILDETHLWTRENGGLRLAATLRRNLAKMGGRSCETTNAWQPGTESVAEATSEYADKVAAGLVKDAGVLRWRPMARVDDLADEPAVRAALVDLYADAPWMDIDRIIAEIYDLSTHPADARRFYLNQVTTADDAWLSEPEWRAVGPREGAESKIVADGEAVTLGFDGSRSRARGVTDATALVGCRLSDGHLFTLGVWEQPEGPAGRSWVVPVLEVEAAVRAAFDTYTVVGFYADPAKWESTITQWEADYGSRLKVKASRDHPVYWWMSGGRATATVRALERFYNAVLDGQVSHDGAYSLTRHVLNARRRVSRSGLQIAKEHPDSPRKIDAAIAAVLAFEARADALSSGVAVERRSRRVYRY